MKHRELTDPDAEKYFSAWIDLSSDISAENYYVIDVAAERICCVSPDNILLCGHSVEEAINSGYNFYAKVVFPDDLPLWNKIRKAVFDYIDHYKENEDEMVFTCSFRLKYDCSSVLKPLPLMIYHTMKAVRANDERLYFLCSIKSSKSNEAGNLCMYNKKDKSTYEKFNLNKRRWEKLSKESLTKHEIEILRHAQQGKKNKEIADLLCKSVHTVRNQIKAIYSKLNVHSMKEAIEFASYHKMIHSSKDTKKP